MGDVLNADAETVETVSRTSGRPDNPRKGGVEERPNAIEFKIDEIVISSGLGREAEGPRNPFSVS
jgi:hypothetical protein